MTIVLISLLLLASCGNDPSGGFRLGGLGAAVKDAFGGPQPEPVAPVTRAEIAQSPVPLLQVAIPSRGAEAILVPAGRNAGVTTWATADGSTLALRGGVLVASRGLGHDLMSAAVPTDSQILAGQGRHSRSYYTLDGADRTVRHDFSCVLSRHEAPAIQIVDRLFPVHEVRETCEGPTDGVVNRYWISREGRIVRSLQWLGTDVGFLQLTDLSA
ncbi:YjbF family lipoprotein [Halodurantibacterium flavum]|uniref:YjbF family lipoprotein n=1 Tax=Halodurantibacterium flavum TaxID=1382802 RepID=A0ABW4S765_9RHOB